VVTGADSGIGKAVAIAFAREGADVVISYLDEHEDAEDTRKWVEDAGRTAVLVPGDVTDAANCRTVIDRAVQEFGRVDILVSNAAFQGTHQDLTEISDEEWDPVQPGPDRRAPLEGGQALPGRQQCLLQRVLGVCRRPEQPVAVHLKFTPVRADKPGERDGIARLGPVRSPPRSAASQADRCRRYS
jgi:hypothetical protein